MISTRSCALVLICCSLIASGVCATFGSSWSDRLSSHRGFFQVTVAPEGPAAWETRAFPRPRRTIFVVMDGLGHHEAETMGSLAQIGRTGQCRKTYVGSQSMSRPVYAVMSTGLEQDRTGSRGNDDTSPLAAESIWEIATRSGLKVSGVSELAWWRELFPRGFTTYDVRPRHEDFFKAARPADLMLIHTVYIDELSHDHGAGSSEVREAVRRADRELWGLLGTIDPQHDLLIVTADHGHSLRGGHGGQQERVVNVLTCYAGPGVQKLAGAAPPAELPVMRTTSVGPSLALLLGLRFPSQMLAGVGPHGDDLDVLWQIADERSFPPGYLRDRRAEVERFRAANREQLLRWLPESGGSWDGFYRWHAQRQARSALLWAVPFLGILGILALAHRGLTRAPGRRQARVPGALVALAWIGFVWLLGFSLQVLLRGSFDLTSTNHREEFIHFTCAVGTVTGTVAVALHMAWRRSLRALMLDLSALLCLSALAGLMHPAVLGWKLGFPIPRPELIFFPYFAALFVSCLAGIGMSVALTAWIHAEVRRRRAAPLSD